MATDGFPLFANLPDDDPALAKSVEDSKRTLPLFFDAASKMRFAAATYLVKVPFIDRRDLREPTIVRTRETASDNPTRPICHIWLRVTSVFEGLVFCFVGEAPAELRLNKGTAFVVESEYVNDWMINLDGEVYGGYSLRVIRSRLKKAEQLRFDAHTGIRSFKELAP